MLNVLTPGARLTAAVLRFFIDTVDPKMQARFPRASRFLFLHDFAEMAGYDGEARRLAVDWGLRIKARVDAVYVAPPPLTPLVGMALAAGAMSFRLAGLQFETVDDLGAVIRARGIRLAG